MRRKLITSALPYVNNVPHLGNLIQVLSADVYARFCRLRGYETLYICGTDEYGTATETKAAQEGLTPQALCDRYYEIHSAIYKWFNISFDKFGRTSTALQTEIVQDIFNKLDAAGYIKKRTIKQLYCLTCQRFLADRYVLGICPHCAYSEARGDQCEVCGTLLEPTELKDPRCSSCGQKPEIRSTDHLYIDLPAIKPKLDVWLKTASQRGHWARNSIQMTQAWIRDGLRERAITRDLKWGIPVPKPGYESKVFYVWFDAPIGYISITANLGLETGQDWRRYMEKWWKDPDNVELVQFIGKDNIPFHTVIFPCSLLGSGERWTMLHHMSSTEYLNYENGKFSKSKGIGVFGNDAMETNIPADVWRFYIYYNRPEKADAVFNWKDFQDKVNAELIGNFGNLVNRVLAFINRYYDGLVPELGGDDHFRQQVVALETLITEKLERVELRDAFRMIFDLSSLANKAFQAGEPWKFRQTDPTKAASLMKDLCYVVRDLGLLMQAFLPTTADKLAAQLNLPVSTEARAWKNLGNWQGLKTIAKPQVLFAKLEDELVEKLRDRYSGTQSQRTERQVATRQPANQALINPTAVSPQPDNPLSLETRFLLSLDLRVARIKAIERHPKADKLYIESLDTGGLPRTIVSGLVPFYTEEELLGKSIILAYNLKSAKIRGVESHGMLLAASAQTTDGAESLEVLSCDGPIGTKVSLAKLPGDYPTAGQADDALPEIGIEEFFSIPIRVKAGQVMVGESALVVGDQPLKTTKVLDGSVG